VESGRDGALPVAVVFVEKGGQRLTPVGAMPAGVGPRLGARSVLAQCDVPKT